MLCEWRTRVLSDLRAHTAPAMYMTKSVRTDGEGGFKSTSFLAYCASSGIIIERSVAGENHAAYAEAAIRSLKQMSRSMLLRAPHLNRTFWSDALLTACYIRNRTPVAGIGNRTPESLWSGTDTDVGHLRTFGSPCAVHVPRKQRGRGASMALTSVLGVIIGYDPNYAGCYTVWVPSRSSILQTTHTGDTKSIINRLSVYADENTVTDQEVDWPSGPEGVVDESIADGWFTPNKPEPTTGNTNTTSTIDTQLNEEGNEPSTTTRRNPKRAVKHYTDALIGSKIRKKFRTGWFNGTVVDKTEDIDTKRPMWKVTYEDGDSEDLYHEQLVPHIVIEPPDAHETPHECNHTSTHDTRAEFEHFTFAAQEEMDSMHHVDPIDSGATIARCLLVCVHACFTMTSSWRKWATAESCYNTGTPSEHVPHNQYADSIKIPKSVKSAYAGPNAPSWRQAIRRENESLDKYGVFTWVDRRSVPIHNKILRGKYVLRVKCDGQGLISRFKARLVILGHLCVESIHYTDTYAPAARSATVKLVLALAAILNLDLRQYDVETAFLHGDLVEEIYVYVPEGYEPTDAHSKTLNENQRELHSRLKPGCVARCNVPLYGLPQSPRCWWKKITSHLESIGFTASVLDPCLMYRINKDHYSVLALVVDDIVYATNEPDGLFLSQMEEVFTMKDLGELEYCLGIKVTRDRKQHMIELSQENYIHRVLRTFNMET